MKTAQAVSPHLLAFAQAGNPAIVRAPLTVILHGRTKSSGTAICYRPVGFIKDEKNRGDSRSY
jgi:hypothetical protein